MSDRRYGGRYSPGGTRRDGGSSARSAPEATVTNDARPASRFRGRRAARVDIRVLVLFVLPTPLLFAALGAIGDGDAMGAGGHLLSYSLLLGGAFLLREGQRAEAAYEARAVARRPAVPRKIIAALAAGLGVALATLTGWGQGAVTAAGMGLLATGAHLLAFGLDPLGNKGIDVAGGEAGRVAEALDRAEAELAEITRLAHGIRDREIETRVDRLMSSVRGLLKQLEADPRDLPRARRYLSVYLRGAHEATRKYAENHAAAREGALAEAGLRAGYIDLLADLELSFQRGREMLLEDDRTDLEVEIEVLRERLAQETR